MAESFPYIMESDVEIERLERKTHIQEVQNQARWAGLRPGMRVADIGCGSGKPAFALFEAVQPGGRVVGVDGSRQRIDFAAATYGRPGLDFICRQVSEPLGDIGLFDFVWVRFFLEYHRSRAFEWVKKFADLLKPGGILCLIDLDYNCLSHYEMPAALEEVIRAAMSKVEREADFDSRMGIKLYSFLYDLGFEAIDLSVGAHHLIFGRLKEEDDFNWAQKIDAMQRSGYSFASFNGGFEGFKEEFHRFFSDPRRFSYTPIIACRGCKPQS